MPISADHLFVSSMDVDPDKDALLNEVYASEHIPLLGTVPGVISVVRFQRRPLTISIGGELRTIELENEPRYTAIYELESPEVLVSDAWAEAIEKGRWSQQVRPFTRNARRVLLERIHGT